MKGKADDAAESNAKSWSGSAGSASSRDWIWIRADERASDPRVQNLGSWVYALGTRAQTTCASTLITRHAVLTAAHCIDGGVPPGAMDASIRFVDRACGHGPCDQPFPEGELAHVREDIGVLWSVDEIEPRVASAFPRLVHVEGEIHSAVVVTGAQDSVYAVCRPTAEQAWGEAGGEIEEGDSGSPVFALTATGPVVLGVVSHRKRYSGGWYYAITPLEMPWPSVASDVAPQVGSMSPGGLLSIEDCR